MKRRAAKPKVSILQEAAAVYRTKATGSRMPLSGNDVARWLGGKRSLPVAVTSDFHLLAAGAAGLPKSSVDRLAEHLGISRKSMAEDVLDLSVKTIERKAAGEKLDKRTSSHAIEIAKLLQRAFDVFEDEGKVRRWMNSELRALGGLKPVQLLDTFSGLSMVADVLGRIEEGVYS